MATRSNTPMSLQEVDNINNMLQALKIIKQLNIKVSSKSLCLEEAKFIIKDSLHKKSPPNINLTSAAIKDDIPNRVLLKNLFAEAEEYISKLPRPFKNDLEQMFPNYERQLKVYSEELQYSQCVLLIAGDTGSGKSSLINLLLGLQLLPTSELRCTAAIVEISYGPQPLAIAHWRSDTMGEGRSPVRLQCDSTERSDPFLKELHELIVSREEETDESPFERIQVYWPLETLQGGLTIVDSPGVGDTVGMPKILADYMERAFGFVYVIDSTCGVHKHRLGQLLLKAVEANEGFEHTTTLFVCNRWDQVPPGDSDRLKDAIVERLSMILPDLMKSQLYPISVKESKLAIDYGHVKEEHRQLMDAIRRFLPQAMAGRLKSYYRYLSHILKRSLYSLRISYKMHKKQVEKIRQDHNTVETQIVLLEKSSKEKLEMMRQEVKRESFDAGMQAQTYLSNVQHRLYSWRDRECPAKDKSWQNILKNANFAIAERVAIEIDKWVHETGFVQNVQRKLVVRVKEQFHLFDDQLHQVQGVLLSGDDMRSFVMEMRKSVPQKKSGKKSQENTGSDTSFLSIGCTVASYFNLDPKDSSLKKVFKEKYGSNPCSVMEMATLKYLDMLNETAIAAAMSKYFDRFVKGIDRFGSLLPQLMKADQTLLQNLQKELVTGQQKLDAFPAMSRTCSALQGKLDMFYVQRLMVTDFTADQIVYESEIGRGSFATVHKATLKLRTGDVLAAVKEPSHKLSVGGVSDVLLEDALLREVEHKNIVKYYGVCRKGPQDNLSLLFIMEYCPFTLKEKCIDTQNSPSSLSQDSQSQREAIKAMTNYLLQICSALCYLHKKSIVHRDLKPENVLLTSGGEVKIADFGLAIEVKHILTCGIGTPVYMAPEILLLDDKYDAKADIYSLAMIMWELWYGKDLANYASMEVVGGLKTTIERGWRPSLTIVHPPSQFWIDLLTSSWQQDPTRRLSAVEVTTRLTQYYDSL